MYANSNNEEDYTSTENTLLAFYRPPFDKDSNLAFRLSQKSTSSNNPIRQVLIGSEQVRGFMASQFLGKFAVSSNVEYRYTAYSGENIGIQIVPFFDSGVIGGSEEDSFKRQMLSSYGIGLRIPLTKINILNFRIDYARTISPFITEDFAFNLTHFF